MKTRGIRPTPDEYRAFVELARNKGLGLDELAALSRRRFGRPITRLNRKQLSDWLNEINNFRLPLTTKPDSRFTQ